MKQPRWNKYESAILLEGYLEILNKKTPRKCVVQRISDQLRRMAINRGIVIDEIYRNESGISSQLLRMESAYLGYTNNLVSTLLFREIVALYKDKKPEFDKLLAEAKAMVNQEQPIEEQFMTWLYQSVSATELYTLSIACQEIEKYCVKKGIITKSLFEKIDLSTAQTIKKAIDNSDFLKSHEQQKKDIISAVQYYYAFTEKLDKSQENENSTSEAKDQLPVTLTKKPKAEQFDYILRNCFENGLALNAIRLDQFRMIYENEFGSELTEDDDSLITQLKETGCFIDGRVYPKQEPKQNKLLHEIRLAIMEALNSGIGCVYISCVMERWRKPLADCLNIYNETTLKEALLSDEMSEVYATNTVFKLGKGKVFPEKEVLRYMKDCHTPVNYGQLEETLWYLPIDAIKHALTTEASLVQVDWETYLYAPNFPASAAELEQLSHAMQEKIDLKGFLVAKDIAEIVNEDCPAISINTSGYKDWAYRNVLKYIFRDEFEFGSSVVSTKGQKLEMWQVYREYCRSYERLTLTELKQFSNEIGVQIYWDDVLSEMVRINEVEMVRKDLIHFNIDMVDHVLEELCPDDYLPIKDIKLYLHFPTVEHPWNVFLLECYLLQYSKKFTLYHVSYSDSGVYGIIVRQDSLLKNYRSVIVDMLSHRNDWRNAQEALSLIVNTGCQARRRFSGLDEVVREASLLREETQKEGK